MPIPSEYDLPKVMTIIQTQFRAGWGGAKVRSGEFELYENGSPCFISSETFDRLLPGSTVTMFIIIGQYAGSARCTPPLSRKGVRFQGAPAKSSLKARNDE
ncbi:hypothetical protein BDZ45DRAFT_147381 [Acephala macrosclerotiorum]|nr:hypothetical protein BDZ45DRAFT_147381 [Acephala macrosclerotiorum]